MSESNIKVAEGNTGIISQILYEDNHIIVLNKFPSQIIQGDKTGDQPVSELLKDYLKIKYNKPGEVFIGVVHRLDRPVSGVTIFARTSKALSRLNESIRNREMKKTYWAVIKNALPQPQGRLSDYLKRDEAKNKSFVVSAGSQNAQLAELDYRLLAKSDKYFLVEIDLITGRHHQIRAQFANLGCPIKGDLKYGSQRSNPDGSIHLHARSLQFIHPVRKEMMKIMAPVPDEPLWNLFSKLADE